MKLNRILSKDDAELALMEYGNYVARYLKPKTKYVGSFKYRLNPNTGRYERRYRNDCGETIRVWIDGSEEDAPILPPFDDVARYEKEKKKIVDRLELRLNPATGRRELSSRDLFGDRVRDKPDGSEEDAPILPPFDDVARYEKEETKIVDGLEYRLNPKTGVYEHWGRNRYGGKYRVQLDETQEDPPILGGEEYEGEDAPVLERTSPESEARGGEDAPVLDDEIENLFGYHNGAGRYCIETDSQILMEEELPVDDYYSKNPRLSAVARSSRDSRPAR